MLLLLETALDPLPIIWNIRDHISKCGKDLLIIIYALFDSVCGAWSRQAVQPCTSEGTLVSMPSMEGLT